MSRLQTNAIRHLGSAVDNLTLDSAGRVLLPNQPAFLTRTHGSSFTSGWAKFTGFTTDDYNIGSRWDRSTHRFTAPVAGRYAFYVGGWMNGNTADARFGYAFNINGSSSNTYICGGSEATTDTPMPAGFVVLNLSANDYMEMSLFLSGGTRTLGTGSHSFYMGGYLLG